MTAAIATPHRPFWRRWELPTWGLWAAILTGWGLVTARWQAMPLWVLLPAGAWLVAWHSSLCHELIHGHPTRNKRINAALAQPPLGLVFPFPIYRALHLAHHRDHHLTDPLDDPESWYVTLDRWLGRTVFGRGLIWARQTLPGRLILGPPLTAAAFLASETRELLAGRHGRRGIWARHALGVAAVLAWLIWICEMPAWLYLLGFVWPGMSLIQLRSFAEHRAAEPTQHRTAIVESTPLFGLLFLFNNLHVVHHARPAVPWYEIPGLYRARRAQWQARNGGLVYRGYRAILARYWRRPIDHPVHPDHDDGARGAGA